MRIFTVLSFAFLCTRLLGQGTPGAGEFVPGSLIHADSLRNYVVYVPPGYDGTEAWPLVISLHGGGSNIDLQIFASNMEPVADTGRFLVVYPQATLFSELGAPFWNDILHPGRVNDVDFLSRLIDQLALDYHINPARVYAAGFSNGGAMSHLLACLLPDRIAAVASVSGPILAPVYENACTDLERPVPLLHMHGTADPIAPLTGGFTPFEGTVAPPIDDYVQFWLDQYQCADEPVVVEIPDINMTDSSTVILRKYENCEPGAEVYYYLIENGSHVWPGGPPVPPGFEFLGTTVNRDIHASAEIWNFFNRHVHPDPAPLPQLLQKTITVDNLERQYLLYVPAAYDGSEPWPLVFNLHGATSSAAEQMWVSGMNAVADTGHFLLAYPEGIANAEGLVGWNDPALPELQDDVLFISDLIDDISAAYSINPSKVYATGMSNGGGMAFTLACALSDRITAIASVTGPGGLYAECNPGREVPILHMHGTADLLVPFEGGVGIFVDREFIAARDNLQFWLEHNGCSEIPVTTEFPDLTATDSSTVILERYNECAKFSEVWFYQINNGGHTWPSGPPVPPGLEPFLGNVNRDINASAEIWNFFNRFTLSPEPNAARYIDTEEIALQVFPNPFIHELSFEFDLPQSAPVHLSLYNTLGQAVTHIADAQMAAGKHRLTWSATEKDLAAGLYYYRLRVGAQEISRPVILSR